MSRSLFGKGFFRYLLARLQKRSKLSAVRASTIHATAKVEPGSQVVGSNMSKHSFCGYDCVLLNTDIGKFCSIADHVYVGGSKHPIHFVSTSPVFLSHRDSVKAKFAHHDFYEMPRTNIGHDVWIGFGARIRAGVNVGHGAVIGMGAVVTRDVAPYTVVAGNPAKKISQRFSNETIEKLLKSAWWDYSDKKLYQFGPFFNNPEVFLNQLEKN